MVSKTLDQKYSKRNIKDRFQETRRLRLVLVALLLLGVCLPSLGCSNLRKGREYGAVRVHSPFKLSNWGLYPFNRLYDLGDTLVAGIQVGPGLNVRGKLTNLITVTFPTNSCGPELGLNTYWNDEIDEQDGNFLVKRYAPATFGCHGGKSLPFPILKINAGEIETSPDTVDLGAHLLLVGAHIGIRPVEIMDFIVGFFFIDLNSDDLWVESEDNDS